MEDDEDLSDLTPATIHSLAWDIRDGVADSQEAKRLLRLFVSNSKAGIAQPYELIKHFEAAFEGILSGTYTPERALGLAKKRGRPKADPEIRLEIAHNILLLRMKGYSHQDAVQETVETHGWEATVCGESWAEYKQSALIRERLTRALDSYPWSPAEIKRLEEIFKNESWFIAPGKSANKPA